MISSSPDISPSLAQQRAAVYANQCSWVERIGALDASAQPRPIFQAAGVLAVRTGMTGAIMLPHPPVNDPASHIGAMSWLRHNGSGDVLVWSAGTNREIDRWLSAHGAREGFSPLWMIRDLQLPLPTKSTLPAVRVREIQTGDLPLLLRETAIPYASPWQVRSTHRLATSADGEGHVRVVVALLENRVVGRAVVNLVDSSLGDTAGIYDLAVRPDHRHCGIGRALTQASLRIGRDAGARFGTLNATPMGEPMYRAAGFDEVDRGQTWFLPEQTLRHPPADAMTSFAMMISGGQAIPPSSHLLARAILPNGDSPLAHAARFRQPEVARQLLAIGTVPDIAALWRLGLHDEARAMMQDPLALDTRRGPDGATPLHLAILDRDDALLTALLDAGASPYLRDKSHQGDAWDWAHALNNDTALRILTDRFPESGTT